MFTLPTTSFLQHKEQHVCLWHVDLVERRCHCELGSVPSEWGWVLSPGQKAAPENGDCGQNGRRSALNFGGPGISFEPGPAARTPLLFGRRLQCQTWKLHTALARGREGERGLLHDPLPTDCFSELPAGKWPVGVNPDQEPAHCETGGLIKDKECRSGQSAVSVPNNYVV